MCGEKVQPVRRKKGAAPTHRAVDVRSFRRGSKARANSIDSQHSQFEERAGSVQWEEERTVLLREERQTRSKETNQPDSRRVRE